MIYLSSPNNQMQAHFCNEGNILISYAVWSPWLDDYVPTFERILLDSGAYSVMNSGKALDKEGYRDWVSRFDGLCDAFAGIDDIEGDWKQSLKNYEKFGGFPTIHDSDPRELLADLIPIAQEYGWIGIGLVPPRDSKGEFVRWVCDNVPPDLHIHGWALGLYNDIRRIDSTDATNWFRKAWSVKEKFPWLTAAECTEIMTKKYKRQYRGINKDEPNLFEGEG